MSAAHVIRDLAFEIGFASEAEAFEQQEPLRDFVAGRLMSVADEVFSKVSPLDGEVIRIDRLDIELGEFAPLSYYEEAEKRFREKLEEALRLRLDEIGGGIAGAADSVLPASRRDVEIVLYFLVTGSLPWNAPALSGEALADLLLRVVAEQGRSLAERLRAVSDRAALSRRLAWQFDDPAPARIAAILEPGEIGFIEEVTGRADVFRQAGRRESETKADSRRVLWEFTFAFLLENGGSQFNRVAYLRSVVRRMAAHYNRNEADLAAELAALLDKLEASGSRLKAEMSDLLAGLRSGPASAAEPRPGPDGADRFETALLAGDAPAMEAAWNALLPGTRLKAGRVLRRHGRNPSVQRALAWRLTLPTLRSVAALLEPLEIGFIEEVAARPELFHQAAGREEAQPPSERLLWEFTFAFLLEAGGSRFNRRSYLRNVVGRMAAHYNMREAELAASLAGLLDRIEAPGSRLRMEMSGLLADLRDAPEAPCPPGPDDADRFEWALLAGDMGAIEKLWPVLTLGERRKVERMLRYHGRDAALRRALTGHLDLPTLRSIAALLEPQEIGFIVEVTAQPEIFRAPPSPGRLLWELTFAYLLVERGSAFNRRSYTASLVRQMAAHHNMHFEDLLRAMNEAIGESGAAAPMAADLRALLRELPAAPESGPTAAAVLRSRDLHDHLLEILKGGGPDGKERAVGMIEELRRDHPWLFQRLLRTLGVEAALRNAAAGEILAHFARRKKPAVRQTSPANFDLEAWLLRGEPLAGAGRAGLAATLERLSARPDEAFLALLRKIADRPDKLRQLCVSLPERQLARLLLLVAAPGAHRLVALGDMILAASGAEIGREGWQVLFAWLGDGAALSDQAFVERFVSWLAHRSSVGDPASLAARMAARLRHEADPRGARLEARLRALSDRPAAKAKDEKDYFQHLLVGNAGLVLAGPYLPRLFAMSGLIAEGRFRDEAAAERGVHLLHYLATGSTNPAEHRLPLDKILCGLEPDQPVRREIDLLDRDKEAADGLIEAMIAHWSAIGRTSVEGFRESFFLREGRLQLTPAGFWQLVVQQRAFDMLLDRLPWGFKTIRHSWMNKAVHVEWR